MGLLLASCMQGPSEVPRPTPTGTLELSPPPFPKVAAFAVVHSGPHGETSVAPTIQVVFNRPLRPLGVDVPVPAGLEITPDPGGRWEWLGTQGLVFVPQAGELPRATRFVVKIPSGLVALDGAVLEQAHEFSFDSPLPQVVSSSPNKWFRNEARGRTISLTLSDPVEPHELEPFFEVRVGDERREVTLHRGRTPQEVEVRPSTPWPLGAHVVYSLRSGWSGKSGLLPAVLDFRDEFDVHGPLRAELRCDRDLYSRCRPGSYMSVDFSTPVPALAFARGLKSDGASPLHVDKDYAPEATVLSLYMAPHLKPGDAFTLSFDKGLKDIFGQPLSFFAHNKVVVGDYRPDVTIGFSGDVVPESEAVIPILSVNTSFELYTKALTTAEYIELRSAESPLDMLKSLPQVERVRVMVGTKNVAARRNVDLKRLIGGRFGPFAIGIEYKGEDGVLRSDCRVAQRTNLGLTAKLGRDETLAWVTSLVTGQPEVGAKLTVVGQAGGFSSSDETGLARLVPHQFLSGQQDRERPSWLLVEAGDDRFLRSNTDPIDPWRIPTSTDFYGKRSDTAFLFPERDLFRPGQSAWIKGYIRRPSAIGNDVVRGKKYTLSLEGPSGGRIQSVPVTSNDYGAVAAKITIPQTAPLGFFSVKLEEGREVLGAREIQVAEYEAAEFETKVGASMPEAFEGEPVEFAVTSTYLYGAPVQRAKLYASLIRIPTSYEVPRADDFLTDDDAYQSLIDKDYVDNLLKAEHSLLDDEGKFRLPSKLVLPAMIGPERVEFEAEITDLAERSQASRTSVLVHPASYYVGIERPKSYFFTSESMMEPKVVALAPDGRRISGRPITLELLRLRYAEVRRRQPGGDDTITELVRDTVSQCVARSGEGVASCALHFGPPGRYVLHATSRDERGRLSQSSVEVYVTGAGGLTSFRGWDERGQVSVKLDRDEYNVGDTARVLIESPFEHARAWVTVERDDVYESRMIKIDGSTSAFELPVSPKFRPNAHIGVHLVEDRTKAAKKAHPFREAYRFGYAELKVNADAQRLAVDVRSDKLEYRPRDEVELSLSVRDASGRPLKAETTLFVVDEGVLLLSGYAMTDPLEVFTRPRPLRVETIEGRDAVADIFGLDPAYLANKGGPGGGGGEVRSEFLTTAYFNPGVLTDDRGEAQLRFRLPDNIGRFRVMALAVSKVDQYGYANHTLTVNQPLMVRPQLPRFLRAGDQALLGVAVSSLLDTPEKVKIELSAKGLLSKGALSQRTTLSKTGQVLMEFPVEATNPGVAELRFDLIGERARDAVATTRRVQSPAVFETVSASGKTDTAEAQAIGALGQARPDAGGLQLTLSSSSLVGIQGGFEQLLEYPYSCTEQLSSRVLPLLALRPLAERFSLPLPPSAHVQGDLKQILRRQQGDGGFGMWPESRESSPWVSIYATWVLEQARQQKYFVPDDVMERAYRYVSHVATPTSGDDELSTAAFAVVILGEVGKFDPAQIQQLHDRRRAMPLFARFLLLRAASQARLSSIRKVLEEELIGTLTPRGNRAEVNQENFDGRYFSSTTRTQAIALWALTHAAPNHLLLPQMARALLDMREDGTWANTQESAFALLSLDAYQKAQESTLPNFVARAFLGDKLLVQKVFEGPKALSATHFVPMQELNVGGDFVVAKEGKGTLFYEARLKYARRTLPETSFESGMSVSKQVRRIDAEELLAPIHSNDTNETQFVPGDLVLVEVKVLAPDSRRFVVVEDPLPAGFVAIDTSLQSGARHQELRDADADMQGYSWAWHRRELRDDRVLFFIDEMPSGLYRYRYLARATTAGTFVTPPTVAKEMYQEEVFGRTAATQIRVQR